LDADVPIIFGVLTTHTMEQAIERAEPTRFNRGGEAAKSAIEMARVMEGIKGGKAANDRLTEVKNARRKR